MTRISTESPKLIQSLILLLFPKPVLFLDWINTLIRNKMVKSERSTDSKIYPVYHARQQWVQKQRKKQKGMVKRTVTFEYQTKVSFGEKNELVFNCLIMNCLNWGTQNAKNYRTRKEGVKEQSLGTSVLCYIECVQLLVEPAESLATKTTWFFDFLIDCADNGCYPEKSLFKPLTNNKSTHFMYPWSCLWETRNQTTTWTRQQTIEFVLSEKSLLIKAVK